MEYRKENYIKKYPLPISIKGMAKIIDQMKNSICKIQLNNSHGTGFFCSISFDNNEIKGLITNNHLLNYSILKERKRIELSLNDDQQLKIINLEDKRILYTNEKYDFTFIEIKEHDNIKNFLELDNNFFQENSYHSHNMDSIYIIQYPKENVQVSYGVLKEIKNSRILHLCCTESGSSGSPILSLNTNKVIGMHIKKSIRYNFNKGIYLKYPVKEFYDELNGFLSYNSLVDEMTKFYTIQNTPNFRLVFNSNKENNIEDNSKFNKKNNEVYKKKICNLHFICKNCGQFPLIKFKSSNWASMSCACKDLQNLHLENFFKNYIVAENDKINLIQCNEHHKIFNYYCKECFRDICEDCLLKKKTHSKHKLKYFDKIKFDINIKIEKLKDKLNIKEENFKNDCITVDGNYTIEKLIKILINDLNTSPNNNLFTTIESIYNFIFCQGIEITNIEAIENLNKTEIINSIIINGQNFSNIGKLTIGNLLNLNILSLPNNNIQDISPLQDSNLLGLKFLDLSFNNIDDNAIPIFKNLNLSSLNFINLSSNNLKSFSIFKAFENYNKLKDCFIGNNKFDDDITKVVDEEYYLPSIQEIDLSDGVFSRNSVKIINKFKLPNLEKIYLNNNSLDNLCFIDKLQSQKLEKITLNNNNINIIKISNEYNNLKVIEIKNNKIRDLDSINNIINKLPKLKIINLKGNEINFKNINNQNIFKDIILNKKIKIIYFNK